MRSTNEWRACGKIGVALGAFCALHSLLAYRGTKRRVESLVSEANYRTWYRLFYNAQAVLTTLGLVMYVLRQPDRELYRIQGPLKWLMHTGQFAAALYGAWSVQEYGLARFAGFTDALAWLKRDEEHEAARALSPRESQGPAMDESGRLLTGGAFQYSRHPLNFSAFIIFWLMPRLTRNTLICNLLGSVYMVVGSWHEEQRLKQDFGAVYEEYQKSGVPFFWPRLRVTKSENG